MVRFSDMLGGDGEPDDARAATAPRDLPPIVDDEPTDLDAPPVDDTPEATSDPSPEEVLDRLTRYATAARAADQARPASEPPVEEPEPPAPPARQDEAEREPATGDDLLPRPRRTLRNPRGNR